MANKGLKTELARRLDAADECVELDRADPKPQWEKLKKDFPYGFDVVVSNPLLNPACWCVLCADREDASQVEATGSVAVANDAINYVRRGGSLLMYSIYSPGTVVNWSPGKIFVDEIKAGVVWCAEPGPDLSY